MSERLSPIDGYGISCEMNRILHIFTDMRVLSIWCESRKVWICGSKVMAQCIEMDGAVQEVMRLTFQSK